MTTRYAVILDKKYKINIVLENASDSYTGRYLGTIICSDYARMTSTIDLLQEAVDQTLEELSKQANSHIPAKNKAN